MKTLNKFVFVLVLCFQISSEETQAQSTLRQRNLITPQSTVHFVFVFEENHVIIVTSVIVFKKAKHNDPKDRKRKCCRFTGSVKHLISQK